MIIAIFIFFKPSINNNIYTDSIKAKVYVDELKFINIINNCRYKTMVARVHTNV